MNFTAQIGAKILSPEALLKRIEFWRVLGDKVVFTNGCFDILHAGHIHLLSECSQMGSRVIVGLNSDLSVKKLKGAQRPVNKQEERAILLAALSLTDAIVIFDEDTPAQLIEAVKPDILVKGGDWKKEDIAGSSFVQSYGGLVKTVTYLKGFSSTEIISKLKG